MPTLLVPLTLALIRLDWSAIGAYRRRPLLVAALLGWLLGACPLLVWLATAPLPALGMPVPLRQAVVLMAATSPIVANAAIALMVGLDATLAIVAVIAATALVPLTLPATAAALLGLELEIDLAQFMLRLALMVGCAFAVAWLVRKVVPGATLQRHHRGLDGLTVVSLVVFAVAIMDGVTPFALARPAYALAAIALAFAFNLALQGLGALAFRRLGPATAATAGLLSGNCNMGLVLVALGHEASFELTVFFALAQLPMFILPALLEPAYRRAGMRSRAA